MYTMTTKTKQHKPVEDHRSEDQAKAQFENIRDMVRHLEHVQSCHEADCGLSNADIFAGIGVYYKAGHPTHGRKATTEEREQYHDEDRASRTIQEDPLSVEVRSDWHTPGADDAGPTDYTILLCTGGPACRIIGTLNQYHEPDSARIEHQDCGTPWTEYRLDSDKEALVLTYARQFYYGD